VSRLAVVAFGGNALITDAEHDSIPQQYETVTRTVPHLVDLIEQRSSNPALWSWHRVVVESRLPSNPTGS
jgi:hypothetical protein